MRHLRTRTAFARLAGRTFLLVAAAVALATAGAHAQERAVLIPTAPPTDAELPYNIPLDAWLIPEVLELKTQFADGLAAEFADIAEHQTGEDMSALVAAGRDLATASASVRATISAISAEDVTFGIGGISRIIPAESALRDTLFGFVVWHEFSSAPAKPLMARFESLVGQVADGGEAAGGLAEGLNNLQVQLEAAVEANDGDQIAALTPDIVQTAGRVDAVCGAVAVSAAELGEVIAEISADSGELLREKWADAAAAAASATEPASKSAPALDSISVVLRLLVEMGGVLDGARSSVAAIETAQQRDGAVYIPWTVVRTDWEVIEELDEHILADHPGEDGDAAAEETGGERAEEEHAGHAHAEPGFGDAASNETRARIRSLFPYQVEANAILAEQAVRDVSTLVAGVIDDLEEKLLARAGFKAGMDQRQLEKVYEEVDAGLRKNMELSSARMSAKAARVALADGEAAHGQGAGHEVDALYLYHNAWLHALNAGAAAQRALYQ